MREMYNGALTSITFGQSMQRILISACLAGAAVRYDGTDLLLDDGRLETLRQEGRLVAVCPEVAGGLAVPRVPAEIVGGGGDAVLDGQARVMGRDGIDVTAAFIAGAHEALRQALQRGVVVAILSERSPSCGSGRIYSGNFDGTLHPGSGVTAALLRRHGIAVFNQDQVAEALAVLPGGL